MPNTARPSIASVSMPSVVGVAATGALASAFVTCKIAARHADPRTTMRYDRARKNLDRHPNYILAAYMAFGTLPTLTASPTTAGRSPPNVGVRATFKTLDAMPRIRSEALLSGRWPSAMAKNLASRSPITRSSSTQIIGAPRLLS
ncbi:hypothetical protein [Micromonospora sp. KC606]|uniref:hypothetical protein n=1 Tax=Micromonospora sp. KC606 TaxID=2530379 RepID=UPI001A9FA4E1|nr:hypothetical protein [Micromonospora sp. KC606]